MVTVKLISGVDGVRIRETPVDGRPIGQVYSGEVLQSLESDGDTQSKVGGDGQWLQVRTAAGLSGYIAAWLITYAEEPVAADDTESAATGDGASGVMGGGASGTGSAEQPTEEEEDEKDTEQIPSSTIGSMLSGLDAGNVAAQAAGGSASDQDDIPTMEIPREESELVNAGDGDTRSVHSDATTVEYAVVDDEPTTTPTDENEENEAPAAESTVNVMMTEEAPATVVDAEADAQEAIPLSEQELEPIHVAASGSEQEVQPVDAAETPVPDIPATAYELEDGTVTILVQPTVNALRLRDAPVDGAEVGSLNTGTVLISLESPDDTRRKLGVKDQWLQVQTFWGKQTGYTAAWFLEAYTGEIPEPASYMNSINIVGMNLDALHPLGAPEAHRLDGLGWVRLGYNVSAAKGSEDIQAAYDRYMPHIEDYARAGLKVVLCFTHQTFGEGKNEYWPWPSMTTDKWRHLTERFADMVARIAKQYAGQDLVHAYQVWNEMDAHIGAVASVPMVSHDYAIVLGETIQAIKAVDAQVPVLTGGHTGGPGAGGQYARETIAALPAGVRPDGVAFHPYGRGTPPNDIYANFGHIDDSMNAYLPILPGKPVWITEWGILDCEHHNSADILDYASKLVKYLKNSYPGQVAAMIWYAWAMSMHNGYGLVGRDNQPIQPLNDAFRQL